MPSAIVWFTFVIHTAVPSSRPSISVNSHRGRARSSGAMHMGSSSSRTCSSVPGAGTRVRRRWYERSKSGSTAHTGIVTGKVGSTTRCRSGRTRRVTRSQVSTSRFQSGDRSRTNRPSSVDRAWGSDSLRYIIVSNGSIGRRDGMFVALTRPLLWRAA